METRDFLAALTNNNNNNNNNNNKANKKDCKYHLSLSLSQAEIARVKTRKNGTRKTLQ
jgi:hypothetical protein